jgi:cold shock CspA family protein
MFNFQGGKGGQMHQMKGQMQMGGMQMGGQASPKGFGKQAPKAGIPAPQSVFGGTAQAYGGMAQQGFASNADSQPLFTIAAPEVGNKNTKVAQKIADGEPAYVGRLRSFDADKGAGYIACPEVFNMCGSEVYAFKTILESQGIGVGDTVIFFLHWNTRGQPQATYELLRIASSIPSTFALKGKYKPCNDSTKSFGFIESPEAHEYFQREVYVPKDLAADLRVGQTVAFNIKLNREFMPMASEVAVVDPTWQPASGDLSFSQEDTSIPAPWEGSLIEGTKKAQPKVTRTGELYVGTIKAFNDKNGWGFVSQDELLPRFGNDIFVYHKEIHTVPNKVPGTVIQFELGITEDGKPHVLNGKLFDPSLMEPAAKKQRLG